MPELPEVETIKEALKKVADGAFVYSVDIYNRNLRENIPDNFEHIVRNHIIINIYRRAKYIVLVLDSGFSLIWHLGMSGRIKILDSNVSYIPEKHDHVIIKTDKSVIVYNDARRFGLLTYVKTTDIASHRLFAHIGIDPFSEDFSPSYLIQMFENKKTFVKVALLDQSIIAGIGNIYASEALYEAKISPLRLCKDISFNDAERLVTAIKNTLSRAIAAGGSTLKDYKKPDGSMGYFQFQHCVYGKEGKQCPACTCDRMSGCKVKKIVLGGRSTFYCPRIQK